MATPAATTGDGGTTSQDLILKVLGAVGTGLGVLGFVTFFGGAILWIRAENAGLPANDAVSVVPNSVLVTTGASFLVPAVLLALLAVTLIIVIHLGFGLWRKLHRENEYKQARQRMEDAVALQQEADRREGLATATRNLATQLTADAEAGGGATAGAQAAKAVRDAEAAEHWARTEEREKEALEARAEAVAKRVEAEALEKSAASVLSVAQFRVEMVAGGLIVLLVPTLVNGAIRQVGGAEQAILVLVALVAACVSMGVYEATRKVVWFGVVAFITVGVYLGFAAYFRTDGTPKMEPAAALRSDHSPVVGIYIADTESNLYLGTLPEGDGPSQLMVIPRAQVTDLAIGPLLGEEAARRRALELVIEQCEQTISAPRTDTFPVPKRRGCSKDRQAAFVSLMKAAPVP